MLKKILNQFSTSTYSDSKESDANQINIKSWEGAQEYELNHAIRFMQEDSFKTLFAQFREGVLQLSKGYFAERIKSEFFGGDERLSAHFLSHIIGKSCLDIGPCVFSPLATWDTCKRRVAVEPLGGKIKSWQTENLGASPYDDMILEACGGDEYLPHYNNAIDGAIFCRNMLDHTPNWPFVLSNISTYASSGCYLLLWTDISHHGVADKGHFEITEDADAFVRLVEALGFQVQYKFSISGHPEKNIGVRAIKK